MFLAILAANHACDNGSFFSGVDYLRRQESTMTAFLTYQSPRSPRDGAVSLFPGRAHLELLFVCSEKLLKLIGTCSSPVFLFSVAASIVTIAWRKLSFAQLLAIELPQ